MPTPGVPVGGGRLVMTIGSGQVESYYQANLRWLPKAGTAASPANERGDARQPKGAT
jgi:hypothetical protein